MIDLTATFIRELSTLPEWSILDSRVFGYKIPKDQPAPLALVYVQQNRPFTTPSTCWWDMMVIVDVHSEDPKEAETMAQAAIAFLPTLVGKHPEGVLADCRVASSVMIPDDGWTPVRYRHVVTVDVTARNS